MGVRKRPSSDNSLTTAASPTSSGDRSDDGLQRGIEIGDLCREEARGLRDGLGPLGDRLRPVLQRLDGGDVEEGGDHPGSPAIVPENWDRVHLEPHDGTISMGEAKQLIALRLASRQRQAYRLIDIGEGPPVGVPQSSSEGGGPVTQQLSFVQPEDPGGGLIGQHDLAGRAMNQDPAGHGLEQRAVELQLSDDHGLPSRTTRFGQPFHPDRVVTQTIRKNTIA